MARIRFRFDPEKLIAALAYFASRGVSDLDPMKSNKLLYFADKAHLLKYGRPIIGDTYVGMEHGPVPTMSYNVMKDAFSADDPERVSPLLFEYLAVDNSGRYPRFVAKRAPNMEVLSASDVEILDETVTKYGRYDAIELRNLAHEEPEIRHADEMLARSRSGSVPVSFEEILAAASDNIRAAVMESQENRDFAESLNW